VGPGGRRRGGESAGGVVAEAAGGGGGVRAGTGLPCEVAQGVVAVGDGHPAGCGLGGDLCGGVVDGGVGAVGQVGVGRSGWFDLGFGQVPGRVGGGERVAASVGEPGAVAGRVVSEGGGDRRGGRDRLGLAGEVSERVVGVGGGVP